MDPVTEKGQTLNGQYSDFVPHPSRRNCSIPIPANFAPTDNPVTFMDEGVRSQTATRIYQSADAPPRPISHPLLYREREAQVVGSALPRTGRGRPRGRGGGSSKNRARKYSNPTH